MKKIKYNTFKEYWCYYCNRRKIVCSTVGWYVCEECGSVSTKSSTLFSSSWNDTKTHNYKKINSYDRVKSYETFLKRKKLNDYATIQKLLEMFIKICAKFDTITTHKKKFIMFDYVTIKFLCIIGETQYIPLFKKIKNPASIKKYQLIWDQLKTTLTFK